MLKTEYEYISFRKVPTERRRTSVWECLNNRGQYVIGWVRWHGSWRQYSFFAAPETAYSLGCLRDIEEFITALIAEREGKRSA